MAGRYNPAGKIPCITTVLYVFFALILLKNVSSAKFVDEISPASSEVQLRMKTLEQCVGNGTSIYVIPESERTCPCSLFVSDERDSPVDGDYLVVRKSDYDAWVSTGSEGNLFADVKVKIIPPDLSRGRRRIDIPNEGQHILVVRTKASTAQCVQFDYMFVAKDRKFCPTRMNARSTTGEDTVISHSIIAGTTHVDKKIQDFMVGVYTEGRGACTGSVIGKHWILTAAHCGPEANYTRIFVGGEYFSSGIEHVVTEAFIHPKYSSGAGLDGQITSAVINDVALLRTKMPIDVTPIGVNNNANIPQARDIVRAVGYGLTFSSSERGSLNSVDVSEIPMTKCQQDYRDVTGGYDLRGLSKKHHLCAGPDEVCDGGVCRGDSGGPLMVKRGSYYLQVGVTSFGLDCQYKSFAPDVFARISSFSNWIEETTNQEVLAINGAIANISSPGNRTAILSDRKLLSGQRRRTMWYSVGGGIALFLLISFGVGAYFYVRWRDSTRGK